MSAYERFAKGKLEAQKRPQRYRIHQPQFDSQNSSRSDMPNIYLPDSSEVQIPEIPMWEKKKKPSESMQESVQELQVKREVSVPSPERSPKKRMEIIEASLHQSHNQPSEQQDSQPQQIQQPEIQIEPHTSLSLFQIIKLYLGEYLFRNPYPMRKLIYINNNNEDENEINKKEFEIKFKNEEKEIMHFDNTVTVGNGLFVTVLMLRNVFSYFYIYAWIAVVVLQFIAEGSFLKGPIQYGTNKAGVIVLLIVAIVLQLIADIFSVRKRRKWTENSNFYKVYHHNGRNAEWVNVKAHEIKPGHLYTVVPGEHIPTDCILIHAQHSMIQIKENHLLSCLVQPPSQIVLKQALIKGKNVNLPFSGFFSYEINSPEYSSFQIVGKLNLEEPNKDTHPVGMSQVILRGSINCSDTEIFCLAMQTGIDSLFLKNLQYPYQHRKVYEQSPQTKSKIISDDVSQEIREHESTLIGVPIEKKIHSMVFSFFFVFLFLSGIGVLTNFLFKMTSHNEFYLTQTTLSIANVVVYHLTNFIIFIPVLLIPIFKLFMLFSGSITEHNVSKRPLDLIPDTDKYRKTNTLQGFRKGDDELLDNKKIIFPITIKDHNVLNQLCDIDTIITTIDTFRDESAFILHSIKVKQLTHAFGSNSDMYSLQDLEEIKRFMSFALLTTTKNEYDPSINYDDGIELTAKKYLQLKRVKNAYGEIQINNNDDTKVKHIFSIKPTTEYPYKVTFLEPFIEGAEENPDILVLIRGDPKTILDKAYGKQVALTIQSRRLHEEKDFYVQLMAKTSIRLSDALQIQRAYESNSIEKNFFYKNLDKYISKVQPMGFLIYVNNFFQKKIGQTVKNPVLNKSILNQSRYPKTDSYDADIYDSQHMPNLIILAPASKSSQPQFQSLHTIKNLLMNSYLFNFTLTEVSEKILQDKPSSLEKMMKKLQSQRVLVWDNWDQKDITYTIDIMKKYGKKVLFYIEKDEYMYLMKESDCAVQGGKQAYDANKYSDITLSSRSSVSYFYLTQLIRYDSVVLKQGLLSIFFTQFSKYIFYLVVEFINLFYTRGTGLAVVRTPLYLVVQTTLLLDIFYYLNWKDSMRGETFNKRDRFSTEIFIRMLYTLLQGVFITFICLYSLQTPSDSTGTPHSYHFTYFTIVYSFLHVLLFEKLFNILTSSLSIYKLIVLAVQLLTLYIGFVIVSATDTYGYSGILWNALTGKTLLTAVVCIWICLTLPAVRLLLQLMKGKKLKRGDKAKKTY